MKDSQRSLLLITFFITIISRADVLTTTGTSTTLETSKTTNGGTTVISRGTSETSKPFYSDPCIVPTEHRLILEWSYFYILLGFLFFLSFLVFVFLILWIRDTEKLKKEVRELKKQTQDMEQYGILKPMPFTPSCVNTPKKSDEKESKMKVVDEVTPDKKASVSPTGKKMKKKTKTRKSVKKSAKKKESEKISHARTPVSKTEETTNTYSKDSAETSKTVEADSTEASKTQENSVISTGMLTDKTQEKSPIESIATAELQLVSRKRY